MFKKLNLLGLLTTIAGGGMTPVLASPLVFHGHYAVYGPLVMAVGLLIKSVVPKSAIMADADVVDQNGAVIGKNVSTTSTDPIRAPQVVPPKA